MTLPGTSICEPDIGDVVWLDPRIRELWVHDEEYGPRRMFPDDDPLPVCGEVTGTCWSSIDGAWLTVEYVDLRPSPFGGGHKEEVGLDYGLVVHVPTATFPGHEL